ncbi:hypothetical protein VSR68_27650 [Paraburkholderia phymatum]|uniref:hypothetical protein n=1 Tax=Paraburkholderia phymatum TaxID=148447 RepID=UPI00317D8FF9
MPDVFRRATPPRITLTCAFGANERRARIVRRYLEHRRSRTSFFVRSSYTFKTIARKGTMDQQAPGEFRIVPR